MKQINRWAVATSGGGEWHLELSRQLFTDYEGAATRALELYGRGTGYFYKPVQVAVRALEPEPIHVKNISGFRVGEEIVIRGEWFRITNVIEDQNELWAVCVEQNKVLAGDWEPGEAPEDCECLDDHGTYVESHNVRCMGCAAILEPVTVEPWDGLFVGCATVFRLVGNQIIAETSSIGYEGLSMGEVGLSVGNVMNAVDGYAA